MVVRATRLGLYEDVLRPEGEEFSVKPELFSSAWMEPVDGEAKQVSGGRVDRARQREVAAIEAEISVLQKRLKRLGRSKPKPEVEVL